jgi:hypothetical protein
VSTENKKIVEDISSLLVRNGATEHEIAIDADSIMKVWVRDISFLDGQNAIKEVVDITPSGDVNIDMAGYWRYMLAKCVERTEPQLSKAQLYALKPEIAVKITVLLPQPQDLIAGPLEAGLEE